MFLCFYEILQRSVLDIRLYIYSFVPGSFYCSVISLFTTLPRDFVTALQCFTKRFPSIPKNLLGSIVCQ